MRNALTVWGLPKGSALCDPFTKRGPHLSQTPSDTHFQAPAQVRLTPAETLLDPRPQAEAALHPVLGDRHGANAQYM